MPESKPGDHPLTDILVHGLSVFDRRTDRLIRSLAGRMPMFLLNYVVDWQSPDLRGTIYERLSAIDQQARAVKLGPSPAPDRYPRGMGHLPWRRPWTPIVPGLEEQLHRELSPGHPLYRLQAVAVARRSDRDAVLFYLPKTLQPFAVVTLTWAGHPQPAPDRPHTIRYETLERWVREVLIPDTEEFGDS